MADFETVHRIVESFEVKGSGPVEDAFRKLGAGADKLAKMLGHGKSSMAEYEAELKKIYDALGEIEHKVQKPKGGWFDKLSEKAQKLGVDLKYAVTRGYLWAIGTATAKTREMARQAWDVNVAFDRAQSRVRGLVQGLSDFGKASPIVKANEAQAMGVELMKDYRKAAFETATPLEEIEAAAARINPILSGLGKTQADVTKFTEMSAAAARVYGDRAEEAGKVVAKAIATGAVEGESAFATAFKSMAQLSNKQTVSQRMEKARQVLASMARPLADVTKGTEAMSTRWKILTDDVLQRATKPIYDAIGARIASMVEWTARHSNEVDSLAEKVRDVVGAYSSVEGAIVGSYEVMKKLDDLFGSTSKKTELLGGFASGLLDVVDLVGKAVDWIASTVEGLITGKWDRWEMLTVGIQVKTREVALDVVRVLKAIAEFPMPRWMSEKLGIGDAFDKVSRSIQEDIDERAKALRGYEAVLGEEGTTASTRKMIEAEKGRAAEAARRLLREQKGIKMDMNVGTVVIQQDLRGEEPDAIAIETVRTLEKLGERAYQSTIGGAATALGSGGGW